MRKGREKTKRVVLCRHPRTISYDDPKAFCTVVRCTACAMEKIADGLPLPVQYSTNFNNFKKV